MSILRPVRADVERAYDTYADLLYRVALSQLSCEADAMDAVQDVFIRYMTKAPVFFSDEHEKAWLLRVTVNRCHDLHRQKAKQNDLDLSDLENVAAEDGNAYRELIETLKELPENLRSVVVLHALEGYTLQEVANLLGISLSAAKMRWSRGRDALKSTIEEG